MGSLFYLFVTRIREKYKGSYERVVNIDEMIWILKNDGIGGSSLFLLLFHYRRDEGL